jgi:hypothetical protein
MNNTRKFPEKAQFFQAYATALGIDFNTSAIYAEMLDITKSHLEAELRNIKPGNSIAHVTQVTLISQATAATAATTEAILCAHRVAQDLRIEGYEVEITSLTGGSKTEKLWLGIRLI